MSILNNPALKDHKELERSEEFNNFMHRVGEVSSIVKDLASGDKEVSSAAQLLADKYLDGKIINDKDVYLEVKSERTVINKNAFRAMGNKDSDTIDKDVWMAEMSKDADRRALDKMIRREKADTLKTQAAKAFRREEYDRALSYYNKAIDQIKDNPTFYCDRALTNIKLGNFEKVFDDCDRALRLNEESFKARLYKARAHLELEETDKYEEARKDLEEKFSQHMDLIVYFLTVEEKDD